MVFLSWCSSLWIGKPPLALFVFLKHHLNAASELSVPCAELENHLGIAEKSLAEFIVELAKDKTSVKQFQQVSKYPLLRAASSILDTSGQHSACYEMMQPVDDVLHADVGQGGRQASDLSSRDTMDHHTADEGKLFPQYAAVLSLPPSITSC